MNMSNDEDYNKKMKFFINGFSRTYLTEDTSNTVNTSNTSYSLPTFLEKYGENNNVKSEIKQCSQDKIIQF